VGTVEVVEVRGIVVEGPVVVVVFEGVVEGYMCSAACSIHCYPCCLTDKVLKES
jgi:hypothetical protein